MARASCFFWKALLRDITGIRHSTHHYRLALVDHESKAFSHFRKLLYSLLHAGWELATSAVSSVYIVSRTLWLAGFQNLLALVMSPSWTSTSTSIWLRYLAFAGKATAITAARNRMKSNRPSTEPCLMLVQMGNLSDSSPPFTSPFTSLLALLSHPHSHPYLLYFHIPYSYFSNCMYVGG